jgi:hypothetical protein
MLPVYKTWERWERKKLKIAYDLNSTTTTSSSSSRFKLKKISFSVVTWPWCVSAKNKMTFQKLLFIKNRFPYMQKINSCRKMKKKLGKNFIKKLVPFWPFRRVSGINLVKHLSGRHPFFLPLVSYGAEFSSSWQQGPTPPPIPYPIYLLTGHSC